MPSPIIKTHLIILTLLLYGCKITGLSTLNITNSSENSTINESSPLAQKIENENLSQIKKPDITDSTAALRHDIELKSKGFGIFNYSKLTRENCQENFLSITSNIEDLREELKDTEENLKDEQKDLEEARESLEEARQTGNEDLIKKRIEDFKEQEVDYDNVFDEMEDLKKLFKKYRIIQDTISDECVRLSLNKS